MIRWLALWGLMTAAALMFGGVWLWLERRYPPHIHDEGGHDPYCPGCFADEVRYGP